MPTRHLLTDLPHVIGEEQTDLLAANRHARLLRIVSPPRFRSEPFLQQEDEWVMVLQGEATLDLAGQPIRLVAGDSLLIPAGTPHQVTDTSIDPPCTWLALHLERDMPDSGAGP
ncbi:cupin domain-containing protein [Sedimenticola thiotaurini]|uniref:Cupin type-2 domain-containing protein n=1 Tax=Sedimenticola thiotaurini TaxID=1543721 RepID=A0A0F7K3C3_9GAMM|nr:cupin domain-containing protein [Sedimenticola thiotaurini]AKH21433.1 hypothetical protein AAY24_14955 [Sedimenticola thiotaurini]